MRDGLRRLHGELKAGVAGAVSPRSLRRLRGGLWTAVAVAAAVSATVAEATATRPATAAHGSAAAGPARGYAGLLSDVGTKPTGNAVTEAAAARARLGETETVAAQLAGLGLPAGGVLVPGGGATRAAPASPAGASSGRASQQLPPVGPLRAADLFVVAPEALPAAAVSAVTRLPGVTAVDQLDAARVKVDGSYVAMLGVDPATFRQFAAGPTATAAALWQNVADGGIAVSYVMGEQDHLPLGGPVTVSGVRTQTLQVGGFGTVGITGVDAVVSDAVARSLGLPAGNALVVSAPQARLSVLISSVRSVLPRGAVVAPLVAQAAETATPASAGVAGITGAADGTGLTVAETRTFLAAALSRVGLPYVWGGSGPSVFDCSGLVQWSMRQAGVSMPRVAAEQALTGPSVPLAELQPGDLLFYHTDPTAPGYISHVAVYLGGGLMVQAPEPGKDVEVVPADFGAGFAGAVRVVPQLAAAIAAQVAG